jgi:glutathione peroxidase
MGTVILSAAILALTPGSAVSAEKDAVHKFTMKSIDGKDVSLDKYKGKAMLIVNVASRCGYTPQYKGLEALHKKYAEKGLAVLGVPCNQFGKQEPGTEEEIKEFCSTKYGVTFDMFAKVDVNGENRCELYAFLTSPQTNPDTAGDVQWNFEKFLISKDGKVVARFPSKVKPEDPALVKAVEAELAK